MKRFLTAPAVAFALAMSMGAASGVDAETGSSDGKPSEGSQQTVALGTYLKSILTNDIPKPKARPTIANFSKTWLDSRPSPQGGEEWRCLSEALYFEARGETVKGQFAVAEVILNRVKSSRFPDTLCGVIRQGTGKKYQCQFTYTCDGHKEVIAEPKAFERVSKVARVAIDGVTEELTEGATHYHTTSVRPNWARVYTKTARIGVHVFYRHTYRTASAD